MSNLLKRILYFSVVLIFALFVLYLLLPSPKFPKQPSDSVQSLEEADTESPFRRAYFTNYTRDQVVKHYQSQFTTSLGIPLPTYKLNYPPEDAFQLIRDQTRSTFLEEIVQPFGVHLFVNGFKPKQAKDDIWYKGVHYEQKITLRYAAPSIFIRIPIALITLFTCLIVIRELNFAIGDFSKKWFGG